MKLGSRHGQAFLMFLCLMLTYALRVNLSVGIVAMTREHPNKVNFPIIEINNSVERGLVMSGFFIGYIFLQVPAGDASRKYGTRYLLSGAIGGSGLITLLIPVLTSHGGWIALFILRMLVGLFQGCVYPCINTHVSQWYVPKERSRIFSFIFSGSQMGSIVMLVFGGYLAASPGGWPSIFYSSGAFAILWSIFCLRYGADSPATHRTISEIERNYIEKNLPHISRESQKMKTPWLDIIRSIPMWALLTTFLCNIWGFWTLLTLMPSYISGVLKFNIQHDGLLSALPYICMWIMTLIFGSIADFITNRRILSIKASRKLWNSIAQYGPTAALLILSFIKPSVTMAITLLCISSSLNAAVYLGYLINNLDLAPNLAGTLMGITNGLSNITAILGPLVSSIIVQDETNVEQWNTVFFISAAVFFFGNTIFLIFGTTDVQPWNEPKHKKMESAELGAKS